MSGNKLPFSEHNFEVLQKAYEELKVKYTERGYAMQEMNNTVRSLFIPYLCQIKNALLLPDDLEALTVIGGVIKELESHTYIGGVQ